MAPTGHQRKAISNEKRLSQPSTLTRTPALEKPTALRNNQNILNLNQVQLKQTVIF